MNTSSEEHTAPATPAPLSGTGDSRYHRLLLAVGVVAVVVVAGLLSVVTLTVFDDFDYNSDALYLPALYHDLASGVPIGHWRVATVAGFVPDMPLMFGLLWVTSQDVQLSMVLYGVAIMLLLGAATVYVIGGIVRLRWWSMFLVYAVLYLWIVLLMAGHDGTYLLLFVLMPSAHSGALVAGTFLLGLTLRLFRRPVSKVVVVLWVLTSAATIASDALFLVQYLVPIVICLYVFRRSATFSEGPGLLRTIALCVCSAVIVIAGLAIARKLFGLGSDAVGPMTVQIAPLVPLFVDMYNVLSPLVKGNPATVALSIAAFLLMLVVIARYFWVTYRSRRGQGAPAPAGDNRNVHVCLLFFLISAVVTVVFTTVNNYAHRPSTSIVRYFQPVYVSPAIIAPIYLSWFLVSHGGLRVRAAVVALVIVGCAVTTAVKGGDVLPKRLCEPPVLVRYLDRFHDITGVSTGLGSYWLTKPTHLLSKKGVHVDAAWYPVAAFAHISNLEWYWVVGENGVKRLRKYEFIVPYDKYPEQLIVAKFGFPAMVCQDRSVQMEPSPGIYEGPVMRVLVYNRKSDVAFRNYMYIPALVAAQMSLPSNIEHPQNLQQYKVEGIARGDENCSVISPGEDLGVVFSPPAEGDVLEICADSDDEYEVEVHYTDGRTEKLKVPVLPQYGLGRRILSLSNSGGTSRVGSLVVRAVGGDGDYRIGHVYVFPDNW